MIEIIQAIIKDNKVINCIIAGDSYTYPLKHDLMINITNLNPRPGIGWSYIDGEFLQI